MASEALKRAKKNYLKKVRRFGVECNKETESDLIAYLESKQNVSSFIKWLIREDMKKNI